MNVSITRKSKRNRFVTFSFILNALAIIGISVFLLTGCKKDDDSDRMFNLSINVTPSDAGTIEVSPVSNNGMYKEGSTITLTVKTADGHSFKEWAGDASGSDITIEVLMDGNKTIDANFDKIYNLNLNVTPADGGTVEVTPVSGNGIYKEGSKVTLVAKPTLGYYFKEWRGEALGSKETIEVVMDGNKTINADFSFGINENFDDASANFFQNDQTGCWSVKDTAYVMAGTGANIWRYSWYDYKGFDNFEYSVDVKAVDNTSDKNALGIYFRSQDANPEQNSYKVAIAPAGQWYLAKQINGVLSWIKGWTVSSDIKTGLNQTNNLKVICSGSSIEVFINGVSQGVFTDTEFASGYVGIMGYDAVNYTNKFIFDNITLKKTTSKQAKSAPSTVNRVNNTTGMDPRFSSCE